MPEKSEHESEVIADKFHSLAIHLLRKLRREDESSGLNAPRLSALSVIVFSGPVTLSDLARAEQVRPPTMTRIVNALEELGLITKKKDTADGRSSQILATAAGRQILMDGRERRVRKLSGQIAALKSQERAALMAAAEILSGVVRAI